MPLPAGAEAPPFDLLDADSSARPLDDLGSTEATLLVFFKTSCPTCRLAFPVVAELQRRYGDALPVVAVTQTAMSAAVPWLHELGFDGPVLDDERNGFALSDAYRIRSVPTLVLLEGGRVVATGEGWDRDRMNAWARDLGARTGRDGSPVTVEGDGRPLYKPG